MLGGGLYLLTATPYTGGGPTVNTLINPGKQSSLSTGSGPFDSYSLITMSDGSAQGVGSNRPYGGYGLGKYLPISSPGLLGYVSFSPVAIPQISSAADIRITTDGTSIILNRTGSLDILGGTVSASNSNGTGVVSALRIVSPDSISYIGSDYHNTTPDLSVTVPMVSINGAILLLDVVRPEWTGGTAKYTIRAQSGVPAATQVECGTALAYQLNSAYGQYNCLAITQDGSVWAWGNGNSFGQIGNGTTMAQSTPIQLTTIPERVIQVATDGASSFALTASGKVYGWGISGIPGPAATRPTPALIPGLSNIIEISAYAFNILARAADGSVWCWGENYLDSLGTGTANPVYTIKQVPNINLN
jgi:hypothetical protein